MNFSLKKYTIPLFVFITGSCVLVIEIVAVRILSPYFGNTIFTFSSVISVVLAALSLGYYVGGRLSDKYPKESLFYHIITASGVAVIVLHLLGIVFLSEFGYVLSITQGPIISSFLLFFIQSFLLGLLSPFAVKLQKLRAEEMGIGTVAGQIFFWSTLGSIVGSLGAGFVLIPNFGVDKIILGIGFLLIILGLFGSLSISGLKKFFIIAVIFSILLVFVSKFSLAYEHVLYHTDSLYQKIVIYDGLYGNRPTRFLMQDKNPSAAAFIDSDELVYEYTKYYAIYELFHPNAKEALAIGGGAYSIPKAMLAESSSMNVDVAEIDPLLFELGKKYFNVNENPRLHNFAQDGRRFLHDVDKKYDVIFSDAYASFFSTPEHLTTREFFEMAKEKLNDKGVFIANVVGSLPHRQAGLSQKPNTFVLSEMKTFKSVFENSYFFAVTSPNVETPQNLIFVGYNSEKKIDFKNVKLPGTEIKLSEKMIDISTLDFSNQILLTDNYAPVDYLISKEFKNLQ